MTKQRYLVINADDLGLTHSFNEGILCSFKQGVLTSTSLRANGFAFDDAVKRVLPLCDGIGVGVHVCLHEGTPVSNHKHIKTIADTHGSFKYTYKSAFLFFTMAQIFARVVKEVETEIRSQIEKILPYTPVDHINGHTHIHMIPWIFDICSKLAREYGIRYIRLTSEPFDMRSLRYNKPAALALLHFTNINRYVQKNKKSAAKYGIKYNDVFCGLLHSGFMTKELVKQHLTYNLTTQHNTTQHNTTHNRAAVPSLRHKRQPRLHNGG